MNIPPIFAVCSASSQVRGLLATPEGELKLYMFGLAPTPVEKPYAVWQVVGGSPESYMSGRPDTESHTIQVDVYADSASEARAALSAIEQAIELRCSITSYRGESRDPETRNYRSGFDCLWFTYR